MTTEQIYEKESLKSQMRYFKILLVNDNYKRYGYNKKNIIKIHNELYERFRNYSKTAFSSHAKSLV